jgi:2',3'-cyclic-nucleotide 2'-phosphodiesterase (5'-nucleotidase family)
MSSVGRISLEKSGRIGIEIVPLDSTIQSEKYLRDMEIYYKKDMDLKLSEKICDLEVSLDFRSGITGESLAGNVISDAFRWYHESDIGLINGGGIRADVPAGNFTLKSARSLLPFGNKICQILIKGNELKALLKKNAPNTKGQLLHVSGLSYEYHESKDSIYINWKGKELQDDDLLSVSINNYFLNKLDVDFQLLVDEEDALAIEDFEVLRLYGEEKKSLHPKIQGRFKIVRE